eukprot:831164_1
MSKRQKSKRKSQNQRNKPKTPTTEFEVAKIVNHIVLENKTLYNVEWKPTIFQSPDHFLQWIDEVKNITKIHNHIDGINGLNSIHTNKCHYKIEWKDSWLTREQLNGCDEILPAYILLNMRQQCHSIIQNKKFKNFCDTMVEHSVELGSDEDNVQDIEMRDTQYNK